MNVRLQYDLEFLAGIYYDDQLQFNSYSVSVSLLTQTADAASSNIALERLKCLHVETPAELFITSTLDILETIREKLITELPETMCNILETS